MSLDVFINKAATFYCWVDGQAAKKITWSKLGGSSINNAVLKINNVQRSHVGSYICTAFTDQGILRAISSLRLKGIYIFFLFCRLTLICHEYDCLRCFMHFYFSIDYLFCSPVGIH